MANKTFSLPFILYMCIHVYIYILAFFLQKEMPVTFTNFPLSTFYFPVTLPMVNWKPEDMYSPLRLFVKWTTLNRSDPQSLLKTQWCPGSSSSRAFRICFCNLLSLSTDRQATGRPPLSLGLELLMLMLASQISLA